MDRAQQFGIRAQRLAQGGDMNLYRVVLDDGLGPDGRHQFVLGDQRAFGLGEDGKQFERLAPDGTGTPASSSWRNGFSVNRPIRYSGLSTKTPTAHPIRLNNCMTEIFWLAHCRFQENLRNKHEEISSYAKDQIPPPPTVKPPNLGLPRRKGPAGLVWQGERPFASVSTTVPEGLQR